MRVRLKLSRRDAPCPACLDRDALNLAGQPLFVGGMRLSGGCEECGGKGRVDEFENVLGWPKPDIWTRPLNAFRPLPAEPSPE